MASKKHNVFSQMEKKVFLDVLKSYATIVENKNTDGSSLRQKNVAWDNITLEYNASPHITAEVSSKQLRRLWMNIKQRQRGAITKERQHRMATGGGTSTSGAVFDPDVAQIAPALMIDIPGAIDSDTAFIESADLQILSDQPELSLDITQEPIHIAYESLPTSPHIIITETPHTITTPPPRTTTTPPPRTNTTPPPRTIITPPPPHTIITPPPPRTIITPPPRSTITPPPHSSGTTPPHPSAAPTPVLPIRPAPLPPQVTSSSSTTSFQRYKNTIIEKEYRDRFNRAAEMHAVEMEIKEYQAREAKAKAELAELLLQRERSRKDPNEE